METPVSVPCWRIGPRDLCKMFHALQDALHTKGEDRPALYVVLDEGYIEGMFARWEDVSKAVRDRPEIRSEFTQMTMHGGITRGDQEWQAGCEYQAGKVSIQTSGEARWKRTTREDLEARFRSIDRKQAWPLAVARMVSAGAVAVSLWRDWPRMLAVDFPPLSALAIGCFVLVMVLPYWIFRPVVYFDESIEVRVADLLPWVTLAVSAAKLLESLLPLLR